MTEQQQSGAAVPAMAEEFASGALRQRLELQRKHAAAILELLCAIAKGEKTGNAVQLKAISDFLEQILGRPMPAPAVAAEAEGDILAILTAWGAEFRQKLDRMADGSQSVRIAESDK